MPGGPNVALISHDLWQSRFGGAPDVLGKVLHNAGPAVAPAAVKGAVLPFTGGAILGYVFAALGLMKAKVTNRNVSKQIAKALEVAAARRGIGPSELIELSIPTPTSTPTPAGCSPPAEEFPRAAER